MNKIYSVLLLNVVFSVVVADSYLFNPLDQPRSVNYQARSNAALISTLQQQNYDITAEGNDDDIPNYAGSFTKSLEHDPVTSVLTPAGQASYQQLLLALSTGKQADFNAIVRAPGATMKLVNPQADDALSLQGIPCCLIPMVSAPHLSSDDAAADLIEVYLNGLCRDVRFVDYGTGANTDVDTFNGGSLTNNAAAVLTALGSSYKGPSSAGTVTAAQLFRGANCAPCLVGPYVSQFFYFPLHNWFTLAEFQQYAPVAQAREFGVAWTNFISLQNGVVPIPYNANDFMGERYIITGKDIATAVHRDGPGEIFFNAVNILVYNQFPLAPNLPYVNGDMTNEAPFVTMAITDVYAAMFGACLESMKHAWAHKWRANRRLRPEAFAGLVHYAKTTATNPYDLADVIFGDIAGIDLLAWVLSRNTLQGSLPIDPIVPASAAQTYLMSLVYPEGSPTHPSEPSGHATFSGACATVLKAFFKDDALIKDFIAPVKPDPTDPTVLVPLTVPEGADLLTVGGELDKIASNIAMGRNFAGIHYRADADKGVLLGEAAAINYLRDHARIYTEQGFTGFELTKRDGQRIRITDATITNI